MAGEGADELEGRELGTQAEAAADAIRAAALRLLKGGEVHPRLVVLAAARVAGELGAAAALAGDPGGRGGEPRGAPSGRSRLGAAFRTRGCLCDLAAASISKHKPVALDRGVMR